MLGAIAGDIIGSVYEFTEEKPEYDFPLFRNDSHFTDDTVLTAALAESILSGAGFTDKMREYYWLYPYSSYGANFQKWARTPGTGPYNSWGNGSAMRVSPVGWAYNSLKDVLQKAKESAEVTHNHPEGIKGAQAAAGALFLARTGRTKDEIKDFVTKTFGYNLDLDLQDLIENYQFDVSCQGTVPQAIYTFLISESFEDSIRKAIIIGGDSDTLACVNGSIAEAFYGSIADEIKKEVMRRLDERMKSVLKEFYEKFVFTKSG